MHGKCRFLIIFIFLMLSAETIFGQIKQQKVPSEIHKVMVFTQGAQVYRKGSTNLTGGKTLLIFSGISPNIDKKSIQVKGDGKFTILSVTHQINFLNEQSRREEIQVLENQKARLNDILVAEKNMLSVFKNEENILQKNQLVGGSSVGMKTSDLKEAVDFQRIRLTEVLQKQTEIQKEIHKKDSILAKISQQLAALNQKKNYETSEVLVNVSAKEAAAANFELSYYVRDAGWFVNHDIRVSSINEPINLTMKANIHQNSGEDWKDVKLTVSSGNPTEKNVAPELKQWNLNYGYPKRENYSEQNTYKSGQPGELVGRVTDAETGETLPFVTIVIKGTTKGTQSDNDGNYSLMLPANAEYLTFSYVGYKTAVVRINSNLMNVSLSQDFTEMSEVVVAGYGVTRGGGRRESEKVKEEESKTIPMQVNEAQQITNMSFEIEMLFTVLSDGKIQTADIKKLEIPAIFQYFAAPKFEQTAYLKADITDWQDFNLLDGEANLFFEGAFLGKTIFDLENAGDTLKLFLGKDKGVFVERKTLKEFRKKQFLGFTVTDNRAFEIVVRNNKKQNIKIVIQDQFPVSGNKEIEVEKKEAEGAVLNPDTQILTWTTEIAPKEEKKFSLKYSVKYPKNKIVVLD